MKGVHQIIDGDSAFFFSDTGQVGVTGGCFRPGMAQKGLNMPKT